MNYNRTKY